ncbi:hypothetical protein ElyMa_005198300 [Elysia marginata]|uniref:Uncharacterized protein n=1 Tax=Elysia marginata TaxID=1093978 RepID=A0AAV4JT55_9GAST|nr:hypothetical protein ElyMa_005198300 [Elysia marginata]
MNVLDVIARERYPHHLTSQHDLVVTRHLTSRHWNQEKCARAGSGDAWEGLKAAALLKFCESTKKPRPSNRKQNTRRYVTFSFHARNGEKASRAILCLLYESAWSRYCQASKLPAWLVMRPNRKNLAAVWSDSA